MRTILKHIFISLLVILLITGSALPCFAATETGQITVTLEDKEKNKIDGMRVYLCQIADLNNRAYHATTAFENSGISMSGIVTNPDETVAKTLLDYVKKNAVESLSKTSEAGKAPFSDLNLGIWLVYPEEDSRYAFNPYIVFLPYGANGKVYYEVFSAPKVEDRNLDEINIYVMKKWDDKNNAAKKRPDSIAVELLRNQAVVAAAQLNEENGWAYTFSKLPKDGDYSVREKAVSNYTVDYSGDAVNGFVVTNTYAGEKLPQTGQYWWPIGLIAIAGAGFVLLGIHEMGVKKNGKKK